MDNSRYERVTPKWDDDVAAETIEELNQELSEHMETDYPSETFGHEQQAEVGRLVEDDLGTGPDETAEVIAHDTEDQQDLSAEESAMHFEE